MSGPGWRGNRAPRSPSFHRVGEVLGPAIGREQAEVATEAAVLNAWRDVVGERVASHAVPLRVRGETLVVRADSGPWAVQLRRLGAEITRRLAERTGCPLDAIEVTTGPLTRRDAPVQRRQKRGRVQ